MKGWDTVARRRNRRSAAYRRAFCSACKNQGEYEVTADLTIHGVSKRITIPVHFLGRKQLPGWGDFVGFDSLFTIDRTAFGVNGSHWGGGNLVLSKEVTIHLAIGGMKQGSK